MIMHLGGAIALARRGSESRKNQAIKANPEMERFREQREYIQRNLRCSVNFFQSVIPPKGGKIEGVMVLEAKENIEHSGIFILMKGLPQNSKKKPSEGRVALPSVKFVVLGSTLGEDSSGEFLQIEEGSTETYPLELDIPGDNLPPPLITGDGKLHFKMHMFVSTTEGRHVPVGDVPIRWHGCGVLTREEIEQPLKLEHEVTSKRSYLGLGPRKSAQLEWSVDKSGYLPGEVIHVELVGESKDKSGLEVECKVELIQKLWYQEPSAYRPGTMWVQMKLNVLALAASEEQFEIDAGEVWSGPAWQGNLAVPRGITPTYKVDFTNSVSYTVKMSAGVAGESKENWVTGEVPVLIGSSKEIIGEDGERCEVDGEDTGGGGQDEEEATVEQQIMEQRQQCLQFSLGPPPEHSQPREEMQADGGGGGGESLRIGRVRRSRSICFPSEFDGQRMESAVSVLSRQSLASSTLSLFRLPPSYSELSSRRPSLETLPPAYYDLEFQERTIRQNSIPTITLRQTKDDSSLVNPSSVEIKEREDDGNDDDDAAAAGEPENNAE